MKPAHTPAIATVLWVIGSICLAIGGIDVFAILSMGHPNASDFAILFGGAVAGLLFLAGGSVLDRLSRIEHHLNPANHAQQQAAPDKANAAGY